jgi:hypothetical protein
MGLMKGQKSWQPPIQNDEYEGIRNLAPSRGYGLKFVLPERSEDAGFSVPPSFPSNFAVKGEQAPIDIIHTIRIDGKTGYIVINEGLDYPFSTQWKDFANEVGATKNPVLHQVSDYLVYIDFGDGRGFAALAVEENKEKKEGAPPNMLIAKTMGSPSSDTIPGTFAYGSNGNAAKLTADNGILTCVQPLGEIKTRTCPVPLEYGARMSLKPVDDANYGPKFILSNSNASLDVYLLEDGRIGVVKSAEPTSSLR